MLTYEEYVELGGIFKRLDELMMEVMAGRKSSKSNPYPQKIRRRYKHISLIRLDLENLFLNDFPFRYKGDVFYGINKNISQSEEST